MADFASKTIKEAYPGILHTDNGGTSTNITSTARNVLSGSGGVSKLWLSTSKVGIGLTPTKFFHVKDTDSELHFEENTNNAIVSIIAKGTNSNVAALQFGDAGDNIQAAISYDCTNQRLDLKSDDNNIALSINSSEQVGIGVTDPDTTLEVFSTSAQLKLSYNATDFATFAVGDDQVLTITAAGGISLPQNQKLFFDSSDTYIYADTTAHENLYIGADDDIILQPDDDLIVQAGTTEYVRFDGANQRVGIGTNAPDRQFQVEGSGQQYIRLESTDNNATLELSSSTSGSAETHNSSITFNSGGSSQGTIYYDHHATAASQKFFIKVGDNAVDAMTIVGDGKVGIGTASPVTTLDVDGSFSGKNIEQTTGTVNNLDVSGCTILELNTVGGDITLNGLANGAVGQILYCYKSSTSSQLIISHNSGSAASTDKIYTAAAATTTVASSEYGGFMLIYAPDSGNVNRWFMLNGFDSDVD